MPGLIEFSRRDVLSLTPGEPDWLSPDFLPRQDPAHMRPFVEEGGGVRRLRFDMATVQSAMRLDDPIALELEYTRAMMLCLLFDAHPRRMLQIGLGGGSLAKYVHHTLPQTDLTVAEINPHVVALREQFLVPPDGPGFRVWVRDGVQLLEAMAADSVQCEALLVDGFHFDGAPAALGSLSFLTHCRTALTGRGVMVMNLDSDPALCEPVLERLACAFAGGVSSFLTESGTNRVAFAAEPGWLMATLREADTRLAALAPVHQQTLTRRSRTPAQFVPLE